MYFFKLLSLIKDRCTFSGYSVMGTAVRCFQFLFILTAHLLLFLPLAHKYNSPYTFEYGAMLNLINHYAPMSSIKETMCQYNNAT